MSTEIITMVKSRGYIKFKLSLVKSRPLTSRPAGGPQAAGVRLASEFKLRPPVRLGLTRPAEESEPRRVPGRPPGRRRDCDRVTSQAIMMVLTRTSGCCRHVTRTPAAGAQPGPRAGAARPQSESVTHAVTRTHRDSLNINRRPCRPGGPGRASRAESGAAQGTLSTQRARPSARGYLRLSVQLAQSRTRSQSRTPP